MVKLPNPKRRQQQPNNPTKKPKNIGMKVGELPPFFISHFSLFWGMQKGVPHFGLFVWLLRRLEAAWRLLRVVWLLAELLGEDGFCRL